MCHVTQPPSHARGNLTQALTWVSQSVAGNLGRNLCPGDDSKLISFFLLEISFLSNSKSPIWNSNLSISLKFTRTFLYSAAH